MRTIIIVLYLGGFLFFGSPVLGILMLLKKISPRTAERVAIRVVGHVVRRTASLSGMRVHVSGLENIPDGPVIYAANHRSLFDAIVLYDMDRHCYLAKQELSWIPFLAGWMGLIGCEFIDRQSARSGIHALKGCRNRLEDGDSVVVFPEGTRGHDNDVLTFKTGCFKLAEWTGRPVVPVCIYGSDRILERHFPWIRPSDVEVVFLRPLCFGHMMKKESQLLCGLCYDSVQSTYAGFRMNELRNA